MGSTARLLAAMGHNDSPASRAEREGTWPSAPSAPVSAKRLRRGRPLEFFVRERKRQTLDEQRAAMRASIFWHVRRLADPENEWDRDRLEYARRHHLLRYRFALSVMRDLPPLPFPAEPPPEMVCVQALSPRPVPALRLVKEEFV